MIESGLLLFFLVPGLLSYCGIYGLFHSGKAIAPEPPGVNSIEAVTVVLLCSAVVHTVTAGLFTLDAALCRSVACPISLPASWLDPYARTFAAVERQGATASALAGLLGLALGQGALAYAVVRLLLRRAARRDRLPAWIYGWSTDIANAVDNDDTLVVAYVLTTHDHAGKTVLYGGLLYDMALKVDGSISRLTLWDGERYLADLASAADQPTLPQPLSRCPFIVIEASQIRNIVFETARTPPPEPDDGDAR